jgi:aquaporin Z
MANALVVFAVGAVGVPKSATGGYCWAGIALTFGLFVLAMIYAVGDESGAHRNPAVTFGFFAARRLKFLGSLGILSASAWERCVSA